MRILYGVVGEGMGHAMRSRVILDELVKHHQVQVVVSGRAYDYLQKRASEQLSVKKIWGYTLVYEDNEVSAFKTAAQNLKGALTGWPENIKAYVEITERFEPEVVISDFESWIYLFGVNHRLPILSVDNMQIIDRCRHAPEILEGLGTDFQLTKAIVKAKVAGAAHYYITTFFSCRAFSNFSEFCDRRIDAQIQRALALQTTDPYLANQLWARIDREIVDDAPAIPLYTLKEIDIVSRRVGNYQDNPQWGVILDLLWVR